MGIKTRDESLSASHDLSPNINTFGELIELPTDNQVTYGLGLGACAMGSQYPSGSFFVDPLTASVNKLAVDTLPYEVKRLTREIGECIVENGCMPAFQDFKHPVYGPLQHRSSTGNAGSGESRFRTVRLEEWLSIGAVIPGCMHGAGWPDGHDWSFAG